MASTSILMFLKFWGWSPHRGYGSLSWQMSLSLLSPVGSFETLCWTPRRGPGLVGQHISGCPPPSCLWSLLVQTVWTNHGFHHGHHSLLNSVYGGVITKSYSTSTNLCTTTHTKYSQFAVSSEIIAWYLLLIIGIPLLHCSQLTTECNC
jgi:hypothetical protein